MKPLAKRKRPPSPAKNLAADRNGIPNAPNILKGNILWRTDGTALDRAVVTEILKLRGRKI